MTEVYVLVDCYDSKTEGFPPLAKLTLVEFLANAAIQATNSSLIQYFLDITSHPAYFPAWHLSTENSTEVEYSTRLGNLKASLENALRE